MTAELHPHAAKGQIRRFAKLQQKKFRDREGLFLAEGLRTVTELLRHMPDNGYLSALFVEPDQLRNIPHEEHVRGKIFLIDPEEGKMLSGTSTAQGIVGVFAQQKGPEVQTVSSVSEGKTLVLALDDVQDPGNVGTILRTAAWFGVSALLCGPGTADRYNPKAIRAGAGSVFCLNHYSVDNLQRELEQMQRSGFGIFCSSLQGRDFRNYDALPDRMVLVIGNEANGVSKPVLRMADHHITIPRGRTGQGVESLNAAVSTGIFLAKLTLF